MPGIISRPSGEDVWEGTPVKDEGATESGTPLRPDEPLDHDLQVGLEEKAESLGPTDPPDENTWIDDTGADGEPEGSIAPPDRRRAAMPGVVSRPSGEDVWEGTPVKDEAATEGSKPSKPEDSYSVKVQVENEEKAEDMGPKEPPGSNGWCYNNHDDEAEGSVAPPDRKRMAVASVNGIPVGAPIAADPIGGPVLQLGPAGFEPGSAPELPLAHPKIPASSETTVSTRSNEFSASNGGNCRGVDPFIDFIGEEKGHQDGGIAVPGILQAVKLVDELVISYGGLTVPKPQRPKTPPAQARAVMAF